MIHRFQIEDLIVQDDSGIVFRALDTETNQPVALRRFFPFGPTGGGLREDEQAAYNIAVGRLVGLKHPALRAVIAGGCDPVDGIPYLATEWVDGSRLQSFIDHAPLSPAEAAHLLNVAVEVCELLSHVLAEEAVWVETSLDAIVVGSASSGRGFTLWISPLKWLGKNDPPQALDSLIVLTEEVMGWKGKDVTDQAGGGLWRWFKWLRASASTTTLYEAREMLARSVGSAAPTPTKNLARPSPTKRPVLVRPAKKSSGKALIITAIIALLAIGGGGWALIRWHTAANEISAPPAFEKTAAAAESVAVQPPAPRVLPEAEEDPVVVPVREPEEPSVPGETPEERATRRAAELTAAAQGHPLMPQAEKPGATPQRATTDDALTPGDYQELIAQNGKPVIVAGTMAGIGYSDSGAFLYLEFSAPPPTSQARGEIRVKGAPDDLTEHSLMLLKGKKIRLHGTVKVEPAGTFRRPLIIIGNRAAIEEVK